MEYFFYCRDRAGAGKLREELTEAHWSFMDRYAEAMIARGPTLTADEETATGSVHIVDLPDSAAARVFAFDEPNYRAGVYEDEVLMRRWRNTLGRTMWDFTGGVAGHRRYLILGHGRPGMTAARDGLREEQLTYLVDGYRDSLIACGPLLSDDASAWLGTAILVEQPDDASAQAMLTRGPYAEAGLYESVEVHYWRFGGRSQQ